nr:4-alpha-glucanotransferase [uncultured Merdimonas sp.]
MKKQKEAGILMPVSALPSRTGVGELGASAYQWIDLMHESGVTIWQILPLNPLGYGNSPYQPYSSYAGDELYISLELLVRDGLLKEEPQAFREEEKRVDYEAVRAYKLPYLREAYQNFRASGKEKDPAYQEFHKKEWVGIYTTFRALKKANGGTCWNEWERTELSGTEQEEADFHTFLQYLFYTQWMQVKQAANEKGIRIMGDVPFYVGLDSADVWGGKDNFLLDTDGRPVFIAGVPPDYFSATGQRWGNPIYDWDYMKKSGYQFWLDRIGYSGELFDIVRIDHFRAFDTFWKIPASCPTAIEGEWIEAPGYEVLDLLTESFPDMELVAEDLGELRPEVMTLKKHYHLKGMKILVFAIETWRKRAVDGILDEENMIIYTGTHDNDTLMEWYHGLTPAAKRKVRRLLKTEGFGQGPVKDRLLGYTFSRPADYAIVPIQDILGLGKEGHMNTPGTVGSPNWEWHLPSFTEAGKEMKRLKHLFEREQKTKEN